MEKRSFTNKHKAPDTYEVTEYGDLMPKKSARTYEGRSSLILRYALIAVIILIIASFLISLLVSQ